MSAVLAFLLSNPTVLAVFAAIFGALGWGWHRERVGRQKERAQRDRDRLQSLQDRKDKSDEVDALGPADLDQRFERWLRNR